VPDLWGSLSRSFLGCWAQGEPPCSSRERGSPLSMAGDLRRPFAFRPRQQQQGGRTRPWKRPARIAESRPRPPLGDVIQLEHLILLGLIVRVASSLSKLAEFLVGAVVDDISHEGLRPEGFSRQACRS
jgi:hypothetical protein